MGKLPSLATALAMCIVPAVVAGNGVDLQQIVIVMLYSLGD